MQADLQAFRASKSATPVAPSPVAPSPTPAPTEAPAADPVFSQMDADLQDYRQKKNSGTLPPSVPKNNPNALVEFAKNIFEAPATIAARPFQAAQSFGQYVGSDPKGLQHASQIGNETIKKLIDTRKEKSAAGEDTSRLDTYIQKAINEPNYALQELGEASDFQPIHGGIVAEAPVDAAGVKKDVGRALQTVALGTGAPLAGGALFGVGNSLEEGNDLLSTQTLFEGALGAGGGKVLDFVGKPLLSATGKVVGTITPKILKDVASKGAAAVQKFAAENELLGGIAAKPSAAIARGAQAVDDSIGAGVRKIGTGTKAVLKDQFSGLDATKHYTAVNEKDILRPTTVNEPRYAKATSVYNDAKSRGIDLEKVATERGIIHDKIAEKGVYNTSDTVENIREGNYQVSDKIARPAIKAAEGGVQRVPVADVRNAMLDKVHSIPKSQIDDADRAILAKQIARRYAPGGPADKAHPHGYTLTDLHDSRIISQKNGKYKIGGTTSDALSAQRSREEGRVFSDLFDKTVPPEVGMQAFRKELEKNFLLADYLETLHGKHVPQGITAKAVRLFGRGLGGVLGSKFGGFPGFLVGSRGGDMLFDSFETLPNPIKMSVLENIKKEDPKIFKDIVKYIGAKEAERLTMKLLPAPGQTSYKETPATLFGSDKGGKPSPIKQEAVDINSVQSGAAQAPGTDRRLSSYLVKVQNAQAADQQYQPEGVIPMGPKPKKSPKNLSDIY